LHTEYSNRSNKQLSVALVAERIAEPATRMPVFVIGDFNAIRGSKTLGTLEDAGVTFWPAQGSSFHFNRGMNLFPAIDHIGGTNGIAPVGETFTLRGRFEGEWATDHYPVVGDFILR
jgi:endonuclease/exonuclease/phosphatase family metal-dependent hydrolase